MLLVFALVFLLAGSLPETGKAIARLLAERFPEAAQLRVILVTARSHVARACVVLRHFGAEPITAPVAPKPTDHRLAKSRVFDFIRSTRGLKGIREAGANISELSGVC
jgi:hypothetical protein